MDKLNENNIRRLQRNAICFPIFEKYSDGKGFLTTEDLYNFTKCEKDEYEHMTKEEILELVTFTIRISLLFMKIKKSNHLKTLFYFHKKRSFSIPGFKL